MKKIILLAAFLFFYPTIARSGIISAYYNSLTGSLYTFSSFDNFTLMSDISLRDCQGLQGTRFPKNARNFTVSMYIPSFIIYSDDKQLNIFDIFTKKIQNIKNEFSNGINYITQSENGKYLAVSDGLTIYLYLFEKETLTQLFKKELIERLTSVVIDEDNEIIYISEKTGNVTLWDFKGRLIKSIETKIRAKTLLFDGISGKILIVAKDGIYALNHETSTLSKILNDKTLLEAHIDNSARRLTVANSSGAIIYHYPSLKAQALIPKGSGRIIKTASSNFAAFIRGSSIEIFDIKLSSGVAKISVNDKGTTFNDYNNNPLTGIFGINSDYIDKAAGNKNFAEKQNTQSICQAIQATLSGVYSPINLEPQSMVAANIPNTPNPAMPYTKKPSQADEIKKPVVNFEDKTTIPEPGISYREPKEPFNPAPPANQFSMTEPITPTPPQLEQTKGNNTPLWIIKEKDLAYNQASGSGQNTLLALENAKKKLKNTIVRKVVDDFINIPETASIKNAEIKRRFLWQSSAATALKATTAPDIKEEWTSPYGMKYVLIEVKNDLIKKDSEEYYRKEMQTMRTTTFEDYMNIKPYKID